MIRSLAIVCIGLWTLGVQALPIDFISSEYQTSAAAIAESQADAQFGSSPPADLPLTTSATVEGETDFASGSAVAADGLLVATAEASSASGEANAVGTSEFIGSFFGGGLFSLHFDLTNEDFTDASAFSSGSLILRLISNDVVVLDEVLSAGGVFDRSLMLAFGALNTLEVLLTSEAGTTAGGDASNFSQVEFQASLVPEPATFLLMLPGLLILIAWSRRSRTSQPAAC